MSKSFTLNQLTEGIRDRNVGSEGKKISREVEPNWPASRSPGSCLTETMSRLLENQAAQLLREQNSIGTGAGRLEHPLGISAVSQISHSQSFVEYSAASFPTSWFQFSR